MVKASNILLFPNWDIANALVFNSISNRLNLQDQDKENFQGTTFIQDQATLVSWSLRRGSRAMTQPDESGLWGSIIIRRVDDVLHVEATRMGVDQSQFTLATAKKEEQKMLELQSKYEKFLEAYNQEVKRRTELENKMLKETSRPTIAYPPRPPVEPFKSTPIVGIPDTPKRP